MTTEDKMQIWNLAKRYDIPENIAKALGPEEYVKTEEAGTVNIYQDFKENTRRVIEEQTKMAFDRRRSTGDLETVQAKDALQDGDNKEAMTELLGPVCGAGIQVNDNHSYENIIRYLEEETVRNIQKEYVQPETQRYNETDNVPETVVKCDPTISNAVTISQNGKTFHNTLNDLLPCEDHPDDRIDAEVSCVHIGEDHDGVFLPEKAVRDLEDKKQVMDFLTVLGKEDIERENERLDRDFGDVHVYYNPEQENTVFFRISDGTVGEMSEDDLRDDPGELLLPGEDGRHVLLSDDFMSGIRDRVEAVKETYQEKTRNMEKAEKEQPTTVDGLIAKARRECAEHNASLRHDEKTRDDFEKTL